MFIVLPEPINKSFEVPEAFTVTLLIVLTQILFELGNTNTLSAFVGGTPDGTNAEVLYCSQFEAVAQLPEVAPDHRKSLFASAVPAAVATAVGEIIELTVMAGEVPCETQPTLLEVFKV